MMGAPGMPRDAWRPANSWRARLAAWALGLGLSAAYLLLMAALANA